jgi:3-oxoacyl-[acyl-carrier-protein] synthase III
MANVTISHVGLSGIACAVPKAISYIAEENAGLGGSDDIDKIAKYTGVKSRHLAAEDQCTSDLCCEAAIKLLETLNWQRDSVDVLVLVTQTSDYILPATSCTLQHRLGLSTSCAAFDVNLGCSGYVYGLWIMQNLLSSGQLRRGLLLAGDTISRICWPKDRATRPLFGDAGTATAVEWDDGAPTSYFSLGTDGGGKNHLIVRERGFRFWNGTARQVRTSGEDISPRRAEKLYMNGAEIFTFTLQQVPRMIAGLMESCGWSVDDVDAFVMHQANSFMLKHLGKKMKLPKEKVLIAMEAFGNTSSASIPLALNSAFQTSMVQHPLNLVLAGFGVGYSWAAAALKVGPLAMPEIISTDYVYKEGPLNDL